MYSLKDKLIDNHMEFLCVRLFCKNELLIKRTQEVKRKRHSIWQNNKKDIHV